MLEAQLFTYKLQGLNILPGFFVQVADSKEQEEGGGVLSNLGQ